MAIVNFFQQAVTVEEELPGILLRQFARAAMLRGEAELFGPAFWFLSGRAKSYGQVEIFVLVAVLKQNLDNITPDTFPLLWILNNAVKTSQNVAHRRQRLIRVPIVEVQTGSKLERDHGSAGADGVILEQAEQKFDIFALGFPSFEVVPPELPQGAGDPIVFVESSFFPRLLGGRSDAGKNRMITNQSGELRGNGRELYRGEPVIGLAPALRGNRFIDDEIEIIRPPGRAHEAKGQEQND